MNILVIGSGGMLGHVVTLYLREQGHEVCDVSRSHTVDSRTIRMDVVSEQHRLRRLLERNFDAVINCAALLVKPSQEHKPEAILLNAFFPHLLETWLADSPTPILQVSTDGIFSGQTGAPYCEDDLPDPRTFYGKTKWLGELHNQKDTTVRASFVGPSAAADGTGLLHWLFTSQGEVAGFEGVRFNGVTSLEFAKWCRQWLETKGSGLYHLGAGKGISKGEFLCLAQKVFTLNQVQIHLMPSEQSDCCLRSARTDCFFDVLPYPDMLWELAEWMRRHRVYYSHYRFL